MKNSPNVLLAILLAWLAHPVAAFQDDPSLQKKNVESFELIYETIRKSHWDESMVGESWTQARNELLPKIKAAKSIVEARAVMGELIASLGQSHFAVIPSDSYEATEGVKGGSADIGVSVRLLDNQLIVTRVREGSSAEASGVRQGWQLMKVRDKDAADLIQRFRDAEHGPQRAETIAGMAMQKFLSGKRGEKLELQFSDHQDKQQTLNIRLEKPPGRMSKFGNLPAIRVEDETRTYPNNVGYYRFSAFLDPMRVMPAWRKAVNNPKHNKGFIVDLRGNIGGLAGMTMGMTSAFVSDPVSLGTMTMKGNQLKFVANPVSKPVSCPVAVLVDECSISSAEILAGGLQDLKLARVFGSRTAGLAYPSTVIKLPNGDALQYAIADYHSASGTRLEKPASFQTRK